MSGNGKYLGFDCSGYPGDSTMAWLWGHGFRITGFYLNHGPGGEDDSWISRRALLANAGWGLAPLYLGRETVYVHGNHIPPPANPGPTAATDAAEAMALMRKAGFAPGTTLYFDIEDGTTPSGLYLQYLTAWFAAVKAGGFNPAMYCSHLINAWAAAQGLPHWCFHLTKPIGSGPYDPTALPSASIDSGAVGVQFLQDTHMTGLPTQIDVSWFAVADPSNARPAAAA